MDPSDGEIGLRARLLRRYAMLWECRMAKLYMFVLLPLVLALMPVAFLGRTFDGPETVVVHNGPVALQEH